LDGAGKCVEPPARIGPPTYKIIDLGDSVQAYAINMLGQVVGLSDSRAFIWSAGVMRDLGVALPNHNSSWAQDINNLGHIAANSGYRAYLLRDGQWTNLPGIGAYETHAYAINDSDVVAGISTPSGLSPHAVLWRNGIMIDLMAQGFEGNPSDINNAGAVAGGRSVWYDGEILDLAPLTYPNTGPKAINDHFQVTGAALIEPEDRFPHAFLWTNGSVLDAGALITPESSTGLAVNSRGDVVGHGGGCPQLTFLYREGQGSRDLLSLVASDTKWRELYPRDMNDFGQIVGYGSVDYGFNHGFFMTPIFADFNKSGETDFRDLASFTGCIASPGEEATSECIVGDVDRDGDVDLFDFLVIQRTDTPF
jgi:probable HAF family extracellular repeat protein